MSTTSGASSSASAARVRSAAVEAIMASAASFSASAVIWDVVEGAGAPKVRQVVVDVDVEVVADFFLDLRDWVEPTVYGGSVSTISRHILWKWGCVPIIGASSSSESAVAFQPGTSSSAMMRPSSFCFLFRFLDFLSEGLSAVR